MAECTITCSGNIGNDAPMSGASNPWECHTYKHMTKHTETGKFVSHIAWSISGDIPVDVSIDSGSGEISGFIKHFGDQPSCQDNYPTSELKLDGSNFLESGRYKKSYYDFKFTIKRDYLVNLDNDSKTPPTPESTTSEVFIRVIKNNDLDNYLFIKQYLNAGHSINIEGDKYKNDTVEDALNRHKGPISRCLE